MVLISLNNQVVWKCNRSAGPTADWSSSSVVQKWQHFFFPKKLLRWKCETNEKKEQQDTEGIMIFNNIESSQVLTRPTDRLLYYGSIVQPTFGTAAGTRKGRKKHSVKRVIWALTMTKGGEKQTTPPRRTKISFTLLLSWSLLRDPLSLCSVSVWSKKGEGGGKRKPFKIGEYLVHNNPIRKQGILSILSAKENAKLTFFDLVQKQHARKLCAWKLYNTYTST